MKNCWVNRVNKKNCQSQKSQGYIGHRKVKCETSQALVMINLYVKFNVHCSYVEQVIVLKVADGRAWWRQYMHSPKFWLRPKKLILYVWKSH